MEDAIFESGPLEAAADQFGFAFVVVDADDERKVFGFGLNIARIERNGGGMSKPDTRPGIVSPSIGGPAPPARTDLPGSQMQKASGIRQNSPAATRIATILDPMTTM